MSSLNSPSLSLELRAPAASACLAYGATVVGALTPWAMLPMKPAMGLSVASAAILYLGFRLAGWVGARVSLARVSWVSDGRWFVQDADGEMTECELHHTSRVFVRSAWLCLTPLDARHRRHRLWITPHHLRHPAQLRALLVRLRLDPPFAVATRLEAHG